MGILEHGTKRFSELRDAVGGFAEGADSDLRAMERDGLVTRKIYADVPPRVEYSLTELGVSHWSYRDYSHVGRGQHGTSSWRCVTAVKPTGPATTRGPRISETTRPVHHSRFRSDGCSLPKRESVARTQTAQRLQCFAIGQSEVGLLGQAAK